MGKISAALVVLAVVACMAMAAESTVTCGQVAGSVAPCLSYLRGMGPLSTGCCNGIRGLNSAAGSTPDRQAVCRCLKAAATNIRGVNLGKASGLPGQCGVNIPYKISPSTDCNSVK